MATRTNPIRFGTSGWRGIIAEEVTFSRVRLVTQAIAEHIKAQGLHNRPVVVAYDTRFMSETFAEAAAQVLAENGLETLLTHRDTPTPVVSYMVLRHQAAGAINITASHNPAIYSGIKFTASTGAPALPETTHEIEKFCESYLSGESSSYVPKSVKGLKKKLIVQSDPIPDYLKHLKKMVDIRALQKAKLRIVVDPLFGTARGILDKFLESSGCRLTVLHNYRDVLFGGNPPTPEPQSLKETLDVLRKTRSQLALATDGDGDRFGVLDSDGTYLTPNDILPILLDHLAERRKWKGIVVRSVMTSHFLDAVAKKHGLEIREMPVGFKYIGDTMIQEESVYPSTKGRFVMGGEESGGLTIRGHLPEKDGILACLLMTEVMAIQKKPFKKILENLRKEVGPYYTHRSDCALPGDKTQTLQEKLSSHPPTELAGIKVRRIVDTDGFKAILTDGSWLGLRTSGTESLVRIYTEANSPEKLKKLSSAGQELLSRLTKVK